MRFHVDYSAAAHIHPAVHDASGGQYVDPSGSPWAPPMGLRLRLKASYDMTKLNGYPSSQIIARALQKYGMYVADNGANGGLSGLSDSYIDTTTVSNDVNGGLNKIDLRDFEVVQTGTVIHSSGTARSVRSPRL
jgi:hypothetical protein